MFDDDSRVGSIEALLQRRALEWARAVAGGGGVERDGGERDDGDDGSSRRPRI